MFRFDSFKKNTDDQGFLHRMAHSKIASIPMPTTSWGMLALARLQDDEGELDDVVQLLLTDKATLLLPVSIPSHPSALIDRDFLLDHVVYKDHHQVVSLSGIYGVFEKDQFILLGLSDPPTMDTSKNLDMFSLDPASVKTPEHLKYNILASHVQLPLKQDKQITVMLIQKPVSKKDVTEWLSNRSVDHSPHIEDFIQQFKKNTPRTREDASTKLLDFMGSLHYQDEAKLDSIESYLCTQLYDHLFTHPDGDEAMQDEALESRIAALNLLDLDLSHLGAPIQQEHIQSVLEEAGRQLQQLNSLLTAKEKLDTLVNTHRILVEAIEQPASADADVLLPVLIFTIVKSNPTHFLSNLKFIQRYRRPNALTGQAGYCLTNMMAAVAFLETTNLVGLGLSADKVLSFDLHATKSKNQSGLRLVSDVVDSSYRVFDGLGKFWQRNAQESSVLDRVRKVSDTLPLKGIHEDQKRNKAKDAAPIPKFLAMKSVEELKIGEVTELLADYKRLAAIIKQAGLA